MAKERVYKRPVKASRLIKTLCNREITANYIADAYGYALVKSASLGVVPGYACWVRYSIEYQEETFRSYDFNGFHWFKCLGVKYGAFLNTYSNELMNESLWGRKIVYDLNPRTGKPYTKDDVLETIHRTAWLEKYNRRGRHKSLWDFKHLELLRFLLLMEKDYGYKDESEYYFAVNSEGTVYFFDKENPPPKGKGFKCISKEEAIDIIIQKPQAFIKD